MSFTPIQTLPVLPDPPNTARDNKATFITKADAWNPAVQSWGESFNGQVVNLNAVISFLDQQLPYINTVADADAAIRTNANNIASINTLATHIAALLAVNLRLGEVQAVADNMAGVLAAQGYAEEAHRWAVVAETVSNVGIATGEKAGLVKPGLTMSIGLDGTLDVRRLVFALGYPVVTMTPKVSTGRPANVSLSAPAVLLPGATVAQYHVSVDGGEAQDVTATDNAAVFTFTPGGAAGTTVTLRVTATDSVGNVSLETTATSELVDGYIVTPNIVSPVAGSEVKADTIAVVVSDFSVVGTTDTHVSTDWWITSDVAGTNILVEDLNSSDLLSHTFIDPPVTRGNDVTVWVRFKGQNLGYSEKANSTIHISSSRHGEILYDTDGNPAAVITGSFLSNGAEPWNIRGRSVWLAFALASKRGANKTWGKNTTSSDATNSTDITSIENPTNNWKLASNNTAADGSGSYVSSLSTEAHMDASFVYSQTVKNSKELTDAILAYNPEMMAAKFCRSIVLAKYGAMDLGSIDVGMRMYQIRGKLDEIDPTANAYPTYKMSNWGFGSTGGPYVWSGSEDGSADAWLVASDGNVGNSYKYFQFGCVASSEIPA